MYEDVNTFLSIMNDENRLKIIDMLSCRELMNKQLLEFLEISQPTLSHHIKMLIDGGFINRRVVGTTHYYSVNKNEFHKNIKQLVELYSAKDTCICFDL